MIEKIKTLLKEVASKLTQEYVEKDFEEHKSDMEACVEIVIEPYKNLIEDFEITQITTESNNKKIEISIEFKKTGGRKLASIRKISELIPIKGADFIELAKVDGWQCIVKKGDFKEGDLGVFFEIDSYLPLDERYEFLRKSCYRKTVDGDEGFRIRTMKLRKCLSQGLILPLNLFPEYLIQWVNYVPRETLIGKDVTEQFKVTKWDPPLPADLRGTAIGNFPSFIKKTDQERIQNLPEVFEQHKNVEFEETEKLDGSSMTVYFNDDDFGVCSRNINLKDVGDNLFWRVAKKYKLHELLPAFCKERKCNLALQGEVIGPGIQHNNYKLKEHEFKVFDIWDIDKQRHLTPQERYAIVKRIDGLETVPFLGFKASLWINDGCDKLLDYAKDISTLCPESVQEGVVFKSKELINGQIVSFKAINNAYLLECEFEHDGGEKR